MSRHMKGHREKGTPLKCTEEIYGLINMAEKYAKHEEDKDEVPTVPPAQDEEMKEPTEVNLEDPVTAKDWEAKAGKRLKEIRFACGDWNDFTDAEITEKVSHVTLVRTLCQYITSNAIYVSCVSTRLSNMVADVVNDMKEDVDKAVKKAGEVKKFHKVAREDMTKMTTIVLEKATELEGVGAQLGVANYLRESKDLREKFIKEGQAAVCDALNDGLSEYVKSFENGIIKRANMACIETLRVTQRIGLPKQVVLMVVLLHFHQRKTLKTIKKWRMLLKLL